MTEGQKGKFLIDKLMRQFIPHIRKDNRYRTNESPDNRSRAILLSLVIVVLVSFSCRKYDMYPDFSSSLSAIRSADSLSTEETLFFYNRNHTDACPSSLDTFPSRKHYLYVPFQYSTSTKSLLSVYDCHAFSTRLMHLGKELYSCQLDHAVYGSFLVDYDHFSVPPRPELFSYLIYGLMGDKSESFFIQFEIPENPYPYPRVLDLEYAVQETRLGNKWSDWMLIGSVVQAGSDSMFASRNAHSRN